jgi:predicted regulator of Ras-like GTPase activity (Roadblock/LC7/MglB family)
MSSKLEQELQKGITSIPECVAAGYVDLSTGMLLGVKTVDSHPDEVLELLAAATSDMFQGANVVTIENMFKKSRGVEDGKHYFHEMIVNSENLIHLFMRGKVNEEHVVVFVCRKSANLGMALTKARSAVPGCEAAI